MSMEEPVAVVRIRDRKNDESVTMKIWKPSGKQIVLMPASRRGDQEPIVINKNDGKEVEVIGKVIYSLRDHR